MGQPDFYPLVLPQTAVRELFFIHRVVSDRRRRQAAGKNSTSCGNSGCLSGPAICPSGWLPRSPMATISEVMTRVVETIAPEASVLDAARLMSELDIGALPVCDGEALVGMVTDRDITLRATATGRSPQSTAVAEVMTEVSTCCNESDSVDEVLKKMGEEQIRRIPVVNASRHLVGIVSLGDLATDQSAPTDRTLMEVSQQSPPAQR